MMTIRLGGLLLAYAATCSPQGVPASGPLAAGQALMRKGDFAAAAESFRAVTKRQPRNAAAWRLLGRALHRAGRLDEALVIHEKASGFPRTAGGASYDAACVHALRGHKDAALQWIERAWKSGYRDAPHVRKDPDLETVRKDPRFGPLLARLLKDLEPFDSDVRPLHTFVGESAGDQFGWVAANAGDVDKDGAADVIVGAPSVKVRGRPHGRIYVYSGRTGRLLFTKTGAPGVRLGYSVGGAGDLDRDGHADVVAGGPGTAPTDRGAVQAWSGRTGKLLLELKGEAAGDRFGVECGRAGDLDGDGVPEILVGAESHDAGGKDAGRVYLFSGKQGRPLVTLDGERAGDHFGRAAMGQVAGKQGLLVVGAPKAGARRTGRAYIYKGDLRGKARHAWVLDADATGSALGGMFVSIPGDLDGDRVDDVYVSDWPNTARGRGTGRVYLVSGASGKLLRTLTGKPGESLGIGNAVCGDVDGDGCADLVIGAWQNGDKAPSGGAAYLYSGRTGRLLRSMVCRAPGDTFGFDSTGLGDVNGDGKTDFLITSAWSTLNGPRSGRVFIIAGK